LAGNGTVYGDALDTWMSYLDELGAGVVTEGAVILHRRDGHNTSRIDEIDENELDAADIQIRRAFDTRARLDGHDLLDARIAPVDELSVETLLKRGSVTGARVTLEDGTWPVLEVSPAAAAVIADLDGLRTLRELSATPDAVESCRELLELGALELLDVTSAV
jgi:hypothetical protein